MEYLKSRIHKLRVLTDALEQYVNETSEANPYIIQYDIGDILNYSRGNI